MRLRVCIALVAVLVVTNIPVAAPSYAVAQEAAHGMKIGILTDMSGAYTDVSGRGSVVAAQMAIQDFGGSVLGRPISVVAADNEGKPDTAVTIARRWYDVDGVTAIGDLSGSPIALAVQALGAERKRIALNSTSSSELLTNEQCSRYGVHWTFDSYSVVSTLAAAYARRGSTWFFIATDNAGGHGIGKSLTTMLQAKGAELVGSAYHPQDTSDMSSILLQAQASNAEYIAFSGVGSDLVNLVKQAHEFGLMQSGQKLIALTLFLTDLKAIGLDIAGGLVFPTAFVSASNDASAEWSRRFFDLHRAMPNDVQAGVYSSVLHYLRAVQAAGTDQGDAVMAKMRELPVDDMFTTHGVVRLDGLMVHDMYLAQAKAPNESTGPWDLVKIVKVISGEEAFRPLSQSKCPIISSPH